jgi:small-conductance mechanosensitive channel
MSNWANNVIFEYGGMTITLLVVVRTGLIAILTWAAVRFSKWFWARVEQKQQNFNHSHLYVISRISTFLIVVVGIIVALEYLGMDFSKLTLIASALSVGIGFGLQDIVKNVVAGLVILSERALRIGDWIATGTSTGVIRKINIRSTTIQTWDKTEIIIPNSDLITTQVTNWTLTNETGRITLPIKVAYGSDIELVENTLLAIANNHDSVLTDKSEPLPVVLFIGFGDSALEFELRCFVDDVVNRLFVMSDLYKSVYLEFNRHGIIIPFPQRDIHIHQQDTLQHVDANEG